MATRYAELMGNLKPTWEVDRHLGKAVSVLRWQHPELADAVNAFIVANNSLKTEAAAAITALEARCERLKTALNDVLEWDAEYRASMSPDVEKDQVTLACERASEVLASIESKP